MQRFMEEAILIPQASMLIYLIALKALMISPFTEHQSRASSGLIILTKLAVTLLLIQTSAQSNFPRSLNLLDLEHSRGQN